MVLKLARGLGLAQPALHNGAYHVLSTFRRQARILVACPFGPPRITEVWQHQRSRSGPNGQPPESSHLERAAGFKADDTSEQRLDKLEALLAMGGSRIQAVAPLFAALLSIPFGERYPPLALSPTQQRRRTLAALLDQFDGLARRQPILLVFEDLHWADATSLELLDLTVERMRQLPVLALFTFRPEFEPPWVGLPNVSTLTLSRLDPNEVENWSRG